MTSTARAERIDPASLLALLSSPTPRGLALRCIAAAAACCAIGATLIYIYGSDRLALSCALAALVALAGAAGLLAREGPAARAQNGETLLDNEQWLTLVEDAVELVDELERHRADWDAGGRRVADHVVLRLTELLQRSDVEVIARDRTFDRRRHAASRGQHAGAPIARTISPGFAVERRVLRRARVELEK
jgi:hypothetical protein